jgi:hypothetical protein
MIDAIEPPKVRVKPKVTVKTILSTARWLQDKSGGKLTLAIIPVVARRKNYSRAIVGQLHLSDPDSYVYVAVGPHDVLMSAWPKLLAEAKRCIVIPDKRSEVGAGSILQIQAALAAGVEVCAWDAAGGGLTAQFEIVPLPEPTNRRAAHIVYRSSA